MAVSIVSTRKNNFSMVKFPRAYVCVYTHIRVRALHAPGGRDSYSPHIPPYTDTFASLSCLEQTLRLLLKIINRKIFLY